MYAQTTTPGFRAPHKTPGLAGGVGVLRSGHPEEKRAAEATAC